MTEFVFWYKMSWPLCPSGLILFLFLYSLAKGLIQSLSKYLLITYALPGALPQQQAETRASYLPGACVSPWGLRPSALLCLVNPPVNWKVSTIFLQITLCPPGGNPYRILTLQLYWTEGPSPGLSVSWADPPQPRLSPLCPHF